MASPLRGQIVWLNFSPHAGFEQAGRRPAVVLSDRTYHQNTNYVIACPITSRIRGFSNEVRLPENGVIKGAVLCDQIRSLDRHARKIEPIGMLDDKTFNEIQEKIAVLLGIDQLYIQS